jgi:hypothetical protein
MGSGFMTNHRKRHIQFVLTTMLTGTLLSGGCSNIVRRAVLDGAYGYLSGNVGDTLSSAQFSNFLSDLLTGGVFSPTGTGAGSNP